MKPEYKAAMTVNKKEIDMNPFVESFVAHVIVGMAQSLKGVDYLKTIDLRQDGKDLKITVNGEDVPLTPFPNDVIASTIKGLLTSLKGIDDVRTLQITVKVNKSQ